MTAIGLALCWLLSGAALQAPDFAGTWVLDWTLTDAANAEMGNPEEPRGATITLTVTQDDKVITVGQGDHLPRRYNLDGSESVNKGANADGATTQVSTASWRDGQFRIVTKGPRGEATSIWTIEKGNLRILTTRPTLTGTGRAKTVLVFKRSV